jgi:putative Holliday junction resolvase
MKLNYTHGPRALTNKHFHAANRPLQDADRSHRDARGEGLIRDEGSSPQSHSAACSEKTTQLLIDRSGDQFLYWAFQKPATFYQGMWMHKRIIGLDVGDVRIGVAVSDALGITAQGVSTLRRKSLDEDLMALKMILEEYQVDTVVIGNPLNMDGQSGVQADKVKAFAEVMSERLNIRSILWDERLTTAEARKVLIEGGMRREKRKQVIDQMAAMLILQSYLDAQGSIIPTYGSDQ